MIDAVSEKFVITKKDNGKFTFDFIDNKGNVILSAGNYFRKALCIKAIESVQISSQDNSKFYCKRSIDDKPYFNLKSINGRFLGTSQMYEDKNLRNSAIELLKSKAPNAVIEDQSKNVLKKSGFQEFDMK